MTRLIPEWSVDLYGRGIVTEAMYRHYASHSLEIITSTWYGFASHRGIGWRRVDCNMCPWFQWGTT